MYDGITDRLMVGLSPYNRTTKQMWKVGYSVYTYGGHSCNEVLTYFEDEQEARTEHTRLVEAYKSEGRTDDDSTTEFNYYCEPFEVCAKQTAEQVSRHPLPCKKCGGSLVRYRTIEEESFLLCACGQIVKVLGGEAMTVDEWNLQQIKKG